MANVNYIQKTVGSSVIIRYYEDTAGRNLMAAEQDQSLVAVKDYAVGELFWYNDLLYKTKVEITTGDTITLATDAENTTISAEMIALYGEVTEIKEKKASIELLDDTVGWTGKNKWNIKEIIGNNASVTLLSNGFRTVVNNKTWGSSVHYLFNLKKNTDYILTCQTEIQTAGNFMRVSVSGTKNGVNSTIAYQDYSTNTNIEIAFNSGDYDSWIIYGYVTGQTAGGGDVSILNPMIRDASIIDSTFEPYHPPVEEYIKAIFDTDTDDKPYVFRKGKGTLAKIKKLVGGSLAWNQLVQNGNFADTSIWEGVNATLSVSNNKGTVTVGNEGREWAVIQVRQFPYIANHVYLFSVKYDATNISNFSLFRISTFTSDNISSTKTKGNIISVQKITSVGNDPRFQIACETSSTAVTNDSYIVENAMCIDLTQMFGSTIAEAIYTLEQATEGAGVEWFKNYFPKEYYSYDAGSLQSVNVASREVIGKNLLSLKNVKSANTTGSWDGNTYTLSGVKFTLLDNGAIDISGTANGGGVFNFYYNNLPSNIKAGENYVYSWDYIVNSVQLLTYDANNTSTVVVNSSSTKYAQFTMPENAVKMQPRFALLSGATYNLIIYPMIRLADVEDDTFEPYKEYTFDFDATKQLRGIPKLVNNALQYDGDIYTSDGHITRKYGIVNLGDLYYGITTLGGHNAFRTFPQGLKNYGPSRHMQGICGKYVMADTAENLTCCFYDTQFIIRDDSYNEDTSAFKTAMAGVYLVYELETPTIETGESYQSPQRAFTDGTEEFIDAGSRDVVIPVGHDTDYDLNATYPDLEDYVDGAVSLKVSESMLKNTVGHIGKNKLQIIQKSKKSGNINYVLNDDGSIIVNGSAGESAVYIRIRDIDLPMNLEAGKRYILSGAPNGSSSSTYSLYYQKYTNGSWGTVYYDFGEGVEFEVTDEDNYIVVLRVNAGVAVTNKKFYPMIIDAIEIDKTFEVYKEPTDSSIDSLWSYSTSFGVKNKFDYNSWKNKTASGISNGTGVYENNGITLTATANDCYTNYGPSNTLNIPVSEGEQIKLVWDLTDGDAQGDVYIFPNGVTSGYMVTSNLTKELSYIVPSGVTFVTVRFGVATSGGVAHYKNIMIVSLHDKTTEYVPYAMTNRELTEEIIPLVSGILPQLYLNKLYGYDASNAINIDTIHKPYGYMIRVITTGSSFSGTAPSDMGNALLIIGFSAMINNGIEFGVQIALGFGADKIAFRRAGYNASGGSWGAWKYITIS